MRILHLNDHLAAVGGVESYLMALVPELEKRGHGVHIGFASGGLKGMKNAVKLSHLNSIQFRDIEKGASEVTALIAEVQPDVIHLHGIQNTGVFRAAVATGRAILHGHDYRPICPAANFFYKRSKTICTRLRSRVFRSDRFEALHDAAAATRTLFLSSLAVDHEECRKIRACGGPEPSRGDRFVAAGFSERQVVVNPYFCPLTPLDKPRPIPETPTITFMGGQLQQGLGVFH